MKNGTVLCTGLLCMLFGFQSFSQTPYVSIRNIKTELRIDSSSVLLKVKDKSNLTEIINALNRENINNKVLPIGSDQFILIEDKKLNADNIDLSNIVFKQWVYYVGQAPYYFNGDILLRPNKGVEIERILQLVDHNLELKERLSSGTYIFKVLDG
jgi:hypothetical protein